MCPIYIMTTVLQYVLLQQGPHNDAVSLPEHLPLALQHLPARQSPSPVQSRFAVPSKVIQDVQIQTVGGTESRRSRGCNVRPTNITRHVQREDIHEREREFVVFSLMYMLPSALLCMMSAVLPVFWFLAYYVKVGTTVLRILLIPGKVYYCRSQFFIQACVFLLFVPGTLTFHVLSFTIRFVVILVCLFHSL